MLHEPLRKNRFRNATGAVAHEEKVMGTLKKRTRKGSEAKGRMFETDHRTMIDRNQLDINL